MPDNTRNSLHDAMLGTPIDFAGTRINLKGTPVELTGIPLDATSRQLTCPKCRANAIERAIGGRVGFEGAEQSSWQGWQCRACHHRWLAP